VQVSWDIGCTKTNLVGIGEVMMILIARALQVVVAVAVVVIIVIIVIIVIVVAATTTTVGAMAAQELDNGIMLQQASFRN